MPCHLAPRGFLRCLAVAGIAVVMTISGARAHEFWIDPVSHAVDVGGEIVANLRVGQRYKGDTYSFIPNRFVDFSVSDTSGTRAYTGDVGDRPAMQGVAAKPGLTVITYHSRFSLLRYREWKKFLSFTTNESLTGTVEAHLAAGLPETGFTERYARCAKALVQAGPADPDDRDSVQGMPIELLALENPFVAGLEALPVRLLWQGAPAPDVQIAIFRKDGEGAVTREVLRTDKAGEAMITLLPGARHLLNAVWMARATNGKDDWESHWASLTFAVPGA